MNDNYWNANSMANEYQTNQEFLDLTDIDEKDLLFANAPTPYVNPDYDFDVIGSDISLNGDIEINTSQNESVANQMNESKAEVIDDINDNMADNNIANDQQMASNNVMSNDDGMSLRKRKISFNDSEDEFDESEDSEDESVVSSKRFKSRSYKRGGKGGNSTSRKERKSNNNQCMSRNAIAARENREKKKQYIKTLERENDLLNRQMNEMKAREAIKDKRSEERESELKYYKSLLANDSQIAALIKHVSEAPNFKVVGTSLFAPNAEDASRTTKMAANDSNTRKSQRIASKHENVGICLHINNNNLSFELCNKCSEASKKLIHKRKEKEKGINK